MNGAAWRYAALRSWHGFLRHRGIDSAAALSYFSTLALFPGALTLVSAFALLRDRGGAQHDILAIVDSVAPRDAADALRGPLEQLLSIPNAALALCLGIVLTLWTVSSYVTAFGRAVNNAYEVQEGRQLWKFRSLMLAVAACLVLAFSAIVAILLGTPSIAGAAAAAAGVGEPFVTLWNVGKWPVLAALALLVVAVLYYYSPNVRHLRLRWVSWGASFAILVWAIATLLFTLYVTSVARYDEVYGWLGGAVVTLLWLYLSNLVLVYGAEVDAEMVRARQLESGIAAEGTIQLPLRDSTRNLMLARQYAADEKRGRQLRESAERRKDNAEGTGQGNG